MTSQPSLFISHGAPTILQDGSAAHHHLKTLGRDILRDRKPDAILIMSAHFEARQPTLTASPNPKTIYDFHGFPKELYNFGYTAQGSQQMAGLIQRALQDSGFETILDLRRGFDHGTWIPLSLMFPDADIPVILLSINPTQTSEYHYLLGLTLSELRAQNILIMGSGNLTHNLHEFFSGDYASAAPPPLWVSEFTQWLAGKVLTGQTRDVLSAVTKAPHGFRNHPSMDHIHPLFFAMGAGGEKTTAKRLHQSYSHGVLAMDVYSFA